MSDPIKYMIANLLENATITPSTENATYPVENLVDRELARPFLFTSTGAAQLVIDLGSNQSINTLLIGAHNLVSPTSISIKAGTSPTPSTVVATPDWARDYIGADLGSIVARYITIDIVDANSEATRIGELAVGLRQTLPGDWLVGRGISRMEVDILHKTIRNVKYPYRLADYAKRDYTFRFLPTDIPSFEAFHRSLQGLVRPFWLIEDLDTSKLWYVRKESDLEIQETEDHANPPRCIYKLMVEEESKGSFVVV